MKNIFLILILALLIACTPVVTRIPRGVASQKILIKSEPTKAKIFINDKYLGKTPIKTELWYEKEKFVNIKAEPIYPNQFAQNLFFKIPPIPPKLVIYMNYQAKEKFGMEEEVKPYQAKKATTKDELAEIKIIENEVPAVLPVVLFETDKFVIKPAEFEKIKFMIKLLKDFPDYKLNINAHADIRGTEEYNKELSAKRGKAVKEQFLRAGIAEDRLSIIIHGERSSFDETSKELDLQFNRSVDFTLYK